MKRNQPLIETLESRTLLADAVLIKDIVPGLDTGASGSSGMAALGGKLIFGGSADATGYEPWVSDGTAAGTFILKDIAPGPSFGQSGPYLRGGDRVFFNAYNAGAVSEVWVTDGTVAGTQKVSTTVSNAVVRWFFNGNLIFSTSGGGLYRTNAAGAQATINAQVNVGTILGEAGGRLYFYGQGGAGQSNSLWYTDGNTATSVIDPDPSRDFEQATPGAGLGAQLVYGQSSEFESDQLWVTNGTPAGTHRVGASINPSGGADLDNFLLLNGQAYFTATDGHDYQIYRTDGLTWTKVTSLVGTASSADVRELINVNGTIYFAYSGTGITRTLYKLSGGTTPVRVGTATGGADGGTRPTYLTAVGSTIFFSGFDNADKPRLFESNGTTITKVGGDAGENPTVLTNVNGTLFFKADDATHGVELHRIGGTITPTPEALSVRIKIFPNAQGHTTSLNEGESLTLEALTTGPSIKAYYWDFGDGNLVRGTRKPTHWYGDNFPDDTPSKIRVKVVANDGSIANAYVDDFVVRNTRPKMKFFVPKAFVTYAPMPWSATITDAGDNLDGMKLTIDWGDGSRDEIPVPPGSGGKVEGYHVFTSPQINLQNIQARAIDKDREYDSSLRTVPIANGVQRFLDDPVNTLLDLKGIYIGGGLGADRIKIKKSASQTSTTSVNTEIDFGGTIQTFGLATDEIIYAYTGAGADRVEIAADILSSTYINGGDGNDTIFGGSGNDFLVGGLGADKLYGNGGRNRIKT